jgi:hypothetical protein
MLIMPNLTSDEVSIESLHRDASPVQKDYNNTPYFDVLSFELTAIPSERWIEILMSMFVQPEIQD